MQISSSLLQISKSIHVKTINDTSSNKRERFPKHSGSQELIEFVVVCNIVDAKLIVQPLLSSNRYIYKRH